MTMRLIKITDPDGYTRRNRPEETCWLPVGVRPPAQDGVTLCAAGVYHAYVSVEQALLLDPIHAQLLAGGGRAWWAEGAVVVDDGTQVGCRELVLLESAELPVLSLAARVRAAILCAQAAGEQPPEWGAWAADWLSGADRTAAAAEEAMAAVGARGMAARAAARAAARVAEAARAAAEAAAWAANMSPLDSDRIVRQAIEEEDA